MLHILNLTELVVHVHPLYARRRADFTALFPVLVQVLNHWSISCVEKEAQFPAVFL